MKQTFLVFPAGSTGIALLLLRASVSLSAISQSYSATPPNTVSLVACGLLAFAVFVGFYARTATVLSAAVTLLTVVAAGTMPTIACVTHLLPAIALAMTGPGAISIDAHLFGRRTLHIPH